MKKKYSRGATLKMYGIRNQITGAWVGYSVFSNEGSVGEQLEPCDRIGAQLEPYPFHYAFWLTPDKTNAIKVLTEDSRRWANASLSTPCWPQNWVVHKYEVFEVTLGGATHD